MNFNTAHAIASEISSVDFGFLSGDEIRRLSAKEITCPDTFNKGIAELTPNDGGLYDGALGADRDLHAQCKTCRLDWRHCPGHMGHIALPVPLFHPIFFDSILRLLRSTCQYCFKLRLPKVKLNYYQCQLRLIHHGLLTELGQLANMKVAFKTQKRYDDSEAEEGEEDEESDAEDAVEDLMEKRVRFVKNAIKAAKASKMDWALEKVEALSEARREVIKELLKELPSPNKCFHCKGATYNFKAEGYNKIFEKPLSEKAMNEMRNQGKVRINALARKEKKPESDSEEESEDEEERSDAMDLDEATQTELAPIVVSAGKEPSKQDRFVPHEEVYEILRLMFEQEQEAMTMIFQPSLANLKAKKRPPISCDMFFISVLPVPPTSFRPPAIAGKDVRENAANTMYRKVLTTNEQITRCHKKRQDPDTPPEILAELQSYEMNLVVVLQEAVNTLIDSSKNNTKGAAAKSIEDGIKQKLEKKEGLFRKNMMGKRVNFAARSVISPDPNIETSEIGVPLVFAQKLTYPEPVTDHNFERLRNAVINGPDKYPGASQVEMENGTIIDLGRKSLKERTAIAKQLNVVSLNLLSGRNKKVHRHLRDGDYVLMNRQPTLHKPSIMGHRAKVLPKEKTIRMHYANCNTYNADFDGDEMNMHLPQNDIARAEAQEIASTDWQYLVGTSGKPLRGLIQDHLVMGLWMTNRDTFFTREQYQQLLYSCLRPEDRDNLTNGRILTVPPAFMKPRKLWTGKQVISTIMKNITPQHLPGLFLKSRAKIRGGSWGSNENEEGDVIFHGGELVCGILDKNQFGPSEYGFVHSTYEVFGPTTAGKLLSVLGRLFTKFLHMRAFTCGMDDLLLTPEGNAARIEKLSGSSKVGKEIATKYVGLDSNTFSEKELKLRLENVMREDKQGGLDLLTNSRTKDFTSDVIATCLPSGLVKPFPKNHMQAMTLSGAKGSDVNSSQISCLLGQQTLEGKRVPVMVSGKTLPCFRPYETNVRAGGYIADRFLTGIRPQEYYFHCMAGREGLIDTAVKTSRSGYLQRCLIKGMEGLKVEYDNTVRDSDGSLIQFLYGEDSLDVIKQKHLTDFKFLVENAYSILPRLGYSNDNSKSNQALQKVLENDLAKDYIKSTMKKVAKAGLNDITPDPVMSVYAPGAFVGSVSEKFYNEVQNYIKKNPHELIGKTKGKKSTSKALISKEEFLNFMYLKYIRSLVDPGEAVGIVAGQSIGEPSTQMTLNTFHLAGHATKNVTLGIPRLREIVMTASASISTPSMMLTILPGKTEEQAEWFRKRISRVALSEVVDFVTVTEKVEDTQWGKAKEYSIRFNFFPANEYEEEYGIKKAEVLNTLKEQFLDKLTKAVRNELKKKAKDNVDDSIAEGKALTEKEFNASSSRRGDDDDADDDSDADEEDTPSNNKQTSRQSQAVSYEEPDEGEAEIQANADPEDDEIFQDEGITDMSGNEAEGPRSRKALAKAREEAILESHREVRKFKFDDKKGEWAEIALEFSDPAKILMISIVENICRTTVIRQLPGIKSVTRVGEGEMSRADLAAGKRKLATEGVNFQQIWEWCGSYVDANDIYSNDIAAFLKFYGVEAARAVIVAEMQAVFGGHGISVDSRHLTLIADMMTRAGSYIPFNRIGMTSSISPFMKMSFETTCNFLKDATMFGERDRLENPSSRIVMGKLSGVGTGSFDLLYDLQDDIKREEESDPVVFEEDEDVKMED